MARAASSMSLNVLGAALGVWAITALVSTSTLSNAPQQGHVTSNCAGVFAMAQSYRSLRRRASARTTLLTITGMYGYDQEPQYLRPSLATMHRYKRPSILPVPFSLTPARGSRPRPILCEDHLCQLQMWKLHRKKQTQRPLRRRAMQLVPQQLL